MLKFSTGTRFILPILVALALLAPDIPVQAQEPDLYSRPPGYQQQYASGGMEDNLRALHENREMLEPPRLAPAIKSSALSTKASYSSAAAASQLDSLVLVALYESTNGAAWTTTWDLTQPVSSWFGVGLNAGGWVVWINLGGNNLAGTLPTELGNLDSLESLYLSTNQLTGSLPAGLGGLTRLRYLDVTRNQMTGTVPAGAGQFPALQVMALGSNQFSGAIPTALGSISTLTALYLWGNQLTGAIPPRTGQPQQRDIFGVEFQSVDWHDPNLFREFRQPD